MSTEFTLDEMWKEIEKFGISRTMLEPKNPLPYEQVKELYLVIKQKKIVEEQIRLIEDLKKESKLT